MKRPIPTIEKLEDRQLLAATPVRVTQVFTDNRGQTEVFFNQALNTASLTRKSVRVLSAGADGNFGTGDDRNVARSVGYKKGRLVINANLPANTKYRIRLAGVKGVNGLLLDGEFRGQGKWTGNGAAGGNFDIVTQNAARTRARFTTIAGYMNVSMYTKQAPVTAGNFTKYANAGDWDTTFFHRSVPNFVIQGGGFKVTAANGVDAVTSRGNINNEPGISNTRGTLAMARAVDNNAATTNDRDTANSQWFFNLKDNVSLNSTPDEGFAVFGKVMDTASLRVMDAIARFDLVNAGSPFNELPVRDSAPLANRNISPKGDLILVTRVAMMMDHAATPGTASVARSAAVGATAFSTVSVPPKASALSAADHDAADEEQAVFAN